MQNKHVIFPGLTTTPMVKGPCCMAHLYFRYHKPHWHCREQLALGCELYVTLLKVTFSLSVCMFCQTLWTGNLWLFREDACSSYACWAPHRLTGSGCPPAQWAAVYKPGTTFYALLLHIPTEKKSTNMTIPIQTVPKKKTSWDKNTSSEQGFAFLNLSIAISGLHTI